MKVSVLSSGSKGNTTYIESNNAKILIDLGNTSKYVKEKLEDLGVFPGDIDAILITHTHVDHIGGLKIFAKKYNIPVVTELTSIEQVKKYANKLDIIQIGTRNMYNYELLKEVGKLKTPVILKRGLSATYNEWLLAAEYIKNAGNDNIILCERGIRTYETYTRNTLDLSAIPAVKKLSHLPVVVDPSHAAGKWWMVDPLAKAAVAVGCDGLIIEVHNNPACAWCDGQQSIKPSVYGKLVEELKVIAKAVGREI